MVESRSGNDSDILGRPKWSVLTEVDLLRYHELSAGRLIVDPKEAQKEFGRDVAARLKLSADGQNVLWPQPTSDPEDPQLWSDGRKSLQLLIITLASSIPDFVGSIGVASIFELAARYNTTPNHVNALSANWAIFLLGWGGFAAIILVRRWGRLPVLFYSQLLAFAFLLGCIFAPNLNTFSAMRCIAAFFSTAPQITGLYTVADMYPFHLQARKLSLWTMGFIISPFVSPFFLGFMVAHTDYRWAYAVGAFYSLAVLLMIVFLGEETLFDRTLHPIPARPTRGLRYRLETLLGITGVKMSPYRPRWGECVAGVAKVGWRPHAGLIMLFGGVEFGLSIGITITNAIFLGTAPPVGFGFSQTSISGMYATPIVATLAGEVIGRYGNDFIASVGIRRNRGVFEAEMRLWMCYVSLPLYVTGFLLLGHGVQARNVPAVIMGWGIGQTAIMLNTTAIYAYLQDCFPGHAGEVSALFNFSRTIFGFAVVYFQQPWLAASGGFQVFGCEAAIVVALFILIVPFVQIKGAAMRAKYSIRPTVAPTMQLAMERTNTFRLSQRFDRVEPVAAPGLLDLPSTAKPLVSPSIEPLPAGGIKTMTSMSLAGASSSTVGLDIPDMHMRTTNLAAASTSTVEVDRGVP
ncbi:MFS general substrate transporter [Mycena metata]|uniref:MFS general substrate transporter n=1 Tax=Mycena metata TaxID=1033252 RepID=A0AAD7JHG7_9AGAR|nr:MFS general substrate transporter [Mycena metata]